jgi:capsular polysaccharide transport system ATP-binding protein
MIDFQDVSKTYSIHSARKSVLNNVSFRLAQGERLGIFGANGSGKSTLIRLAAGVEKPSAGTVRRLTSCSWPLGFGGAFQSSLSGNDNIRFIARIYNQPFEKLHADVASFSELGDALADPVRTYSSGMRARFAFGLSISIDFDCMLVDEVIAVGDEHFRQKCRQKILGRPDRSMLFVSHDQYMVDQYCNRFASLVDGNLSFHASSTEALHSVTGR